MTSTTPVPNVDCESAAAKLLSVTSALERIRVTLQPVTGFETIFLRNALGRVLFDDLLSPIDVPNYRNSAMDGYAITFADLQASGETSFRVVGTAFAGQPFAGHLAAGDTVRIMTGAVVPEGADTVVIQEQTVRDGDQVRIAATHRKGDNVRGIGDDIARHSRVLPKGRRLTPADLGLLASLGIAEVRVRRKLRVAFFSTGDELCSLGQPLGAGQIYDSNRYTLHGMLTRLGVEIIDMGVIPDRREAVAEAFQSASAIADVLITSGGVSVGEADFVKETLDALGQVNFWKIAMKPGKPLAFGKVNQAIFFGLPGNPVSAMATFYQLVQPALRQLMGENDLLPLTLKIPCASPLKKSPGRQDFQRGILERNASGALTVRTTGAQGSHILSSMSHANCFIILPAEWGNVEAGTLVEVQPFEGLI
ncbi:MAG TPA: molybdopterin molybdotransferase MoeA [Gammaproteobacteria bacterium]